MALSNALSVNLVIGYWIKVPFAANDLLYEIDKENDCDVEHNNFIIYCSIEVQV
jgi:hypothetical protein